MALQFRVIIFSIEALGGSTQFVDVFIGNDAANILSISQGDTAIGNGGDDTFWLTAAPGLPMAATAPIP